MRGQGWGKGHERLGMGRSQEVRDGERSGIGEGSREVREGGERSREAREGREGAPGQGAGGQGGGSHSGGGKHERWPSLLWSRERVGEVWGGW